MVVVYEYLKVKNIIFLIFNYFTNKKNIFFENKVLWIDSSYFAYKLSMLIK